MPVAELRVGRDQKNVGKLIYRQNCMRSQVRRIPSKTGWLTKFVMIRVWPSEFRIRRPAETATRTSAGTSKEYNPEPLSSVPSRRRVCCPEGARLRSALMLLLLE